MVLSITMRIISPVIAKRQAAGLSLSTAAKLLGISRSTLYDLMQRHRISLDA
jgi:transcriptional regulator of acetoin/glycerol metabolism